MLMKLSSFLLFLTLAFPSFANDSDKTPPSESINQEPINQEKQNARFWLDRMKAALTTVNFEAGVVKLKAGKTESFKWVHGVTNEGIQVEQVAPLIGGGVTTVRYDNTVAFIEPNKDVYSIHSNHIRNFIPAIFYGDASALIDSYQFVLVSKNQIAGRTAQLIRIESVSNHGYNYWVWLDVASGLPMRLAYVNHSGEVIEQVLMTHLTITDEMSAEAKKLTQLNLPKPAATMVAAANQTNNWQMDWLPSGFKLIRSDRHYVSISREVSDYYLYSDGLVEFSVYVQRPLESFKSPVVLQEGATSFVMVHADGFDVTVVGELPVQTAFRIASAVNRKRD